MSLLRALRKEIGKLPPIGKYRAEKYRRLFFTKGSSWPRFHGLFDSREAAEAAAFDGTETVGYDHAEVARVSFDVMAEVWTSDYPVLFWISKLLPYYNTLFDLGGHVGTKYRAWKDLLDFPDDFTWTVCDLPTIVEAGREMASEELVHLRFTTNRQEANDQGILLASGLLQYADFDLLDLLNQLSVKPPHLLINKLPTHKGPEVYTLENLHHSIVPYRIFNEQNFLERLQDSGYRLVDRWKVPESSAKIPFFKLAQQRHLGFYFQSKDAALD